MQRSLWMALTALLSLACLPLYAADATPTPSATPATPAAAPQDGQAAPDFRLQDQKGDWHTLAEQHGKWVVLYFYPKDFTPGCTTEVCQFRDDVLKLHKAHAEVFGVSLDDVKSHADFAEKYHVSFPLLSDHDQVVAKAYGVLTFSQKMNLSYAKRETFLIDPRGKIAKHYVDVDPKENSGQVLADIEKLKHAKS